MFFRLSSWELGLIILAVIGSATLAGFLTGRYLRKHSETLREPFGVLQAALLGVVGLVLAFGLTLAVGRYQDRRSATVDEANAIETAYLRAQLIRSPRVAARSSCCGATRPSRSGSQIRFRAARRFEQAPRRKKCCNGSSGEMRDRQSQPPRLQALRASTWRA